MELVLATSNEHKIDEMKKILAPYHVNVKGLSFYSNVSLPPEDADTFVGNALIKARAVANKLKDKWVLADDSGLVVYSLNGEPGVNSARYATDGRDYKANNEKLLFEMKNIKDRRAAFVCSMVMISPMSREWCVEGRCEGKIIDEEKGIAGFGYDPLFIPDGYDKTFAEMGSDLKNSLSHRGKALNRIIDIINAGGVL